MSFKFSGIVGLLLLWCLPYSAAGQSIDLSDLQTQSRFTRPLFSAESVATRQASPGRMRSPQRTWTGVTLVGSGSVLALYAGFSTCATNEFAAAVFDKQSCGQAAVLFGAGAAAATIGVLLATVWSDVPVSPSRDGFALTW